MAFQETLEAILLEGAAVEDAIVGIDFRNQLVLNVSPMPSSQSNSWCIDGNTGGFHRGDVAHVTAAEESPRQVDVGQHGRQQPLERVNVAGTIVEHV